MRLFDYIRQNNLKADIPVIVNSDIQRQLDKLDMSDDFSPLAEWFGCVAPPFKEFFIEGEVLISRKDTPDEYQYIWNKWPTNTDTISIQRGVWCFDISDTMHSLSLHIPDEARFALSVTPVSLVNKSIYIPPAGSFYYLMDADGLLLTDLTQIPLTLEKHIPHTPDNIQHLLNHSTYTLLTLQAMHKRCPVERATPSRQARRHHQRKHGVDPVSYYILKVKPTPERITEFEEVGQPARMPGKKRAHEVRAHFRYYHPDRPLFGKVSGAVWIPAHDRGDDVMGSIRKDYEIPKQD